MTQATERQGNRRSRGHRLVAHLLSERDEMLAALCRLADPQRDGMPTRAALDEFLNLLIDYMAAAHFGLYQRVIDGSERRRAVRRVAARCYPRVARITELALAFHDRYAHPARASDPQAFRGDLARLAEAIAERIELEDAMIEAFIGEGPRLALVHSG